MPRIENGMNPATGLGGLEGLMAAQQKAFTDAIQLRLDGFAATRGYDNVDSTAKYIGAVAPASAPEEVKAMIAKFAVEAEYMRLAVAMTWAKGYEILNAVLSGSRPMPTLEDVIAELPELVWPGE